METIKHSNEELELKAETSKTDVNDPDILKLNVGGMIFYTLKSTLSKKIKKDNANEFHETHLLEEMYNDSLKENKEIKFIDRDPTYFNYILDYLRCPNKKLILPNKKMILKQLKNEAEYFKLNGLVEIIESLDINETITEKYLNNNEFLSQFSLEETIKLVKNINDISEPWRIYLNEMFLKFKTFIQKHYGIIFFILFCFYCLILLSLFMLVSIVYTYGKTLIMEGEQIFNDSNKYSTAISALNSKMQNFIQDNLYVETDTVKFNVRGNLMEIAKSNFIKKNQNNEFKESNLLEKLYNESLKKNRIPFIDCNPVYFNYILDYLRNPEDEIILQDDVFVFNQLLKEAKYFKLEGLYKKLKNNRKHHKLTSRLTKKFP